MAARLFGNLGRFFFFAVVAVALLGTPQLSSAHVIQDIGISASFTGPDSTIWRGGRLVFGEGEFSFPLMQVLPTPGDIQVPLDVTVTIADSNLLEIWTVSYSNLPSMFSGNNLPASFGISSAPIEPVASVIAPQGWGLITTCCGIAFNISNPPETASFTLAFSVPGPIAGAGLPGLVFAAGGLLAWARRRRTA